MAQAQLSIIIPVWNCWNLTRACLEQLRRATPGDFFEVIVVDNGSTDETITALEPLGSALFGASFQGVRLDENLGFAAACNRGADTASANLLFFLNNDTLPHPGWMKPLLMAPHQPRAPGAWGPLLTYPKDDLAWPGEGERVQHLGVSFTPSALLHLYSDFPAEHPVVTRSRHLQAITGAAFTIPKPLFTQAGGFHEGYKNGYEDLDLCARLREQGHRLAIFPESRITHLASRTPGRMDHNAHNAALFQQRCPHIFSADIHRFARQDGYECAFNEWFSLFVRLPAAKGAELAVKARALRDDSEGLMALTLEEPLWEGGHILLARALEQVGRLPEAARAATLRARFFPGLQPYREMARLGRLAGLAPVEEEASRALSNATALLANTGLLAAPVAFLERWAAAAHEPALAAACTAWLRQHPSRPTQPEEAL